MRIKGIVENGKKLGRTIGFPTANILPDDVASLPQNGVYVAAIWLEGESRPRICMVNSGIHPTVPDGKPTLEAHILNFSGDIYGKRIELEMLHFLRAEKRFENIGALCIQLDADRRATLSWATAHADEYGWQGI